MKAFKKIFAASFLVLFFALPLFAEPTLQSVAQGLSKNQITRGIFTLTRSSPKAKKPLVSSGLWTISCDHGIIWFTKNPVETTSVVTKDFMLVQSPRGQEKKITGQENQIFSQMALLTSALWTNNLPAAMECAKIDFSFEQAEGKEKNYFWQIELFPNDPSIRAALEKIVVCGTCTESTAFATSIQMLLQNGNESLYALSGHKVFESLTDQEKSLFLR